MRRTDEFLTQLRGEEDDEFFDDVSAMRQTTRESIQSQHEWHRREEFRRSTSGWGNVYEEGRSSSHGSVTGHHGERSIPNESKFNLRGAILELVKSKSLRQPKVGTRSMIERLEPSIEMQIRMVNQLLTFRGKHETFGTPQAPRA
ncbi:hypothetical protein V6N13_043126 [Hibiscus sabdariffa]